MNVETKRRQAETALRLAQCCTDDGLAARLRLVAAEFLADAADREAVPSMRVRANSQTADENAQPQ
jgi:hypothetical protein